MGAGGEHIVNDGDRARCRRGERLVDLIDREQFFDRDTVASAGFVRRSGRLGLYHQRADVGRGLAHGAANPLDPVVMVRVALNLRAGHRDECRLGEPGGVKRRAEMAPAGGNRPALIVIALLPGGAGFLLEIGDELIGGTKRITAMRGVLEQIIAAVVSRQARMVVPIALVD